MPRITPLTLNIQIERGERYDLLVEHGTGVFLLSGKITLHFGFAWLAEQAVASKQVLNTEQSLKIEVDGWITFVAHEDSNLFIFTPQGMLARVGKHLGRWLLGYKS